MVEFAGLVLDAKDRNQARMDFVNFGSYFGKALQNQKSLSFELTDTGDGGKEELVLSLSYNLSSYSADGKIKVGLHWDTLCHNVSIIPYSILNDGSLIVCFLLYTSVRSYSR